MPVGEIIAIGTELLLGDIQDTNTAYIARTFRDSGIDLYRTMVVGDNPVRIAAAIQEALARSDIVITTGGLGPTVDDPTRQAVAIAVRQELEFKPDLWDQIQNRFTRFHRNATENNRRQAYLPQGSVALENDVGTAPAFYYSENEKMIISLPGVPREMEHLVQHKVIPLLQSHFSLHEVIRSSVLHTAGVGESQVDAWIDALENNSNPTVGLVAHPGQIDIRITAKAPSIAEADALINTMADEVRKRVGDVIFGKDQDTLEQSVMTRLDLNHWQLGIVECGMGGEIIRRLTSVGFQKENSLDLPELCQVEDLQQLTRSQHHNQGFQVTLGVGFYPGEIQQDLYVYLITPHTMLESHRFYGGPPQHGPTWAVQTALDFLRRNIP